MAKLDDKKKCKKFPFADVLKWAIFSLVMLAPFGAVLGKMLYVTLNPNAKESYADYKTTVQTKLTTINTYQNQEITFYPANTLASGYIHLQINGSYVKEWDSKIYEIWDIPTSTVIDLIQVGLGNGKQVNVNYGGTWYNKGNLWGVTLNSLTIKFNEGFYYQYNNQQNYNTVAYYYLNTTGLLDDSFYYAINEINQKEIFKWTQNTAMYTVINSMTNDLEINTENGNILATLLTYWTLNTAVYLIFDVVIHFSTKLVHMFSGE